MSIDLYPALDAGDDVAVALEREHRRRVAPLARRRCCTKTLMSIGRTTRETISRPCIRNRLLNLATQLRDRLRGVSIGEVFEPRSSTTAALLITLTIGGNDR
jgi:hypothetical protein